MFSSKVLPCDIRAWFLRGKSRWFTFDWLAWPSDGVLFAVSLSSFEHLKCQICHYCCIKTMFVGIVFCCCCLVVMNNNFFLLRAARFFLFAMLRVKGDVVLSTNACLMGCAPCACDMKCCSTTTAKRERAQANVWHCRVPMDGDERFWSKA